MEDTDYVSLVDGYSSKNFKQYVSLFDAWCNQASSLLRKNSDMRVLSLHDLTGKDSFVVKDGQNWHVQLPIYEPIADQIKRLQHEYHFIYTHHLAAATSAEEVKAAVKKLVTLHTQIVELYWYVHLARSPLKTDLEELKEMQDHTKKLSETSAQDPIRHKKAVLKLAAWLKEHASQTANPLKHKIAPTALVRIPPEIGPAAGQTVAPDATDAVFERKKKKEKTDKLGKTSKTGKASKTSNKEKIEHVKDKVLQLVIHHAFPLNKFKFTRHDQCLETFSKSKAYTISKAEFIETIEKDEDLKKLFPKNYKSLTKEKLCDILFKTSKVNVA